MGAMGPMGPRGHGLIFWSWWIEITIPGSKDNRLAPYKLKEQRLNFRGPVVRLFSQGVQGSSPLAGFSLNI